MLHLDLAWSSLGLLCHHLRLIDDEEGQSDEKPYLLGPKSCCPEVATAPGGPKTVAGRVEQRDYGQNFKNIYLTVLSLSCGMRILSCSVWNLVP